MIKLCPGMAAVSAARLFLTVSLALAVVAGVVSGAPAPLQKEHAKPVNPVGDWEVSSWGGGTYHMWFRDDSTYGTVCGWRGNWTVSGRTLTVTEWCRDPERPWTWSVTLGKDLSGTGVINRQEGRDNESPSKFRFALKRR